MLHHNLRLLVRHCLCLPLVSRVLSDFLIRFSCQNKIFVSQSLDLSGWASWFQWCNNFTFLGKFTVCFFGADHYNDVIKTAMVSQITSLTVVYSTVYSGANQRKRQCFASLASVRGIPRSPANPPQRPVTRKTFPFDDVIVRWGGWEFRQ